MPGRKKSAKGKKARGKSAKKKTGKKKGKGKKGSKDAPRKRTPEGFPVPEKGSPAEQSLKLYRCYVHACAEVKSEPVASLLAQLRQLVEDDKATDRIIIEEPSEDAIVPVDAAGSGDDDEKSAAAVAKTTKTRKSAKADSGSDDAGSGDDDDDDDDSDDEFGGSDSIKRREKALWPALLALDRGPYNRIEHIHVWSCAVTDQAVAMLGRQMNQYNEQPLCRLRTLDLVDCTLSSWAGLSLCRSLETCGLTSLCLDYAKLGTEGCRCLCSSLANNFTLTTLSLDFCSLKLACGELIGNLLVTSTIQDLSLAGNPLECAGVIGLLAPFISMVGLYLEYQELLTAAQAAVDAYRAELELEAQKKNPYAKKEEEPIVHPAQCEQDLQELLRKIPPPPPPRLQRLVLAGTALDDYGKGSKQGPAVMIEFVKTLIKRWEMLKELHLHNNRIGDYAGYQLLEALEQRKEFGYSAIYVTVTPHIQLDALKAILKISGKAPGKAKKKKGKGRAKGKGKGKKKKKKKK